VLVPASDGQRQIPLGELARVKIATGPAMIRDEDGLLTGYVFVDVTGRDVGSYVDEASRGARAASFKWMAESMHGPGRAQLNLLGQAALTVDHPSVYLLALEIVATQVRSKERQAC
jgi:Cu(I)/Ag(I) efflux system membrane protein CusA/SilA